MAVANSTSAKVTEKDTVCCPQHADAHLKQGFAVHLYRLSKAGQRLSGRNCSPKSKQIDSETMGTLGHQDNRNPQAET